MFTYPEENDMRALSLCRSRLDAAQRRIDRWHTMTFYSAISFMLLIVLVTLPYRPF
jgi:predicted nucleic acid-binding Zn ribbon protein